MSKKIDLHTHTTFSDGAFSPEELIDKANDRNISILSIVDHDCIDGIPYAINYAQKYQIEIIPGVELSADYLNKEIHILGYFFDHTNKKLISDLKVFSNSREGRAKKIILKLNQLGLKITFEDVKKITNAKVIGRPHIAQTMYKLNLIPNFYHAFENYLYDNGPAYVKKFSLSPPEAIKMIHNAGGKAFVAHPMRMTDEAVRQMISYGIDGFEVNHPSHSTYYKKRYSKIVKQNNLLECGGSDFHGGGRNDECHFGNFFLSESKFEKIRNSVEQN